MIFDIDKIEERISSHNSFFDELIELIPASHYLPKDDTAAENEKYYHNTKKPVASSKLEAKEIRKAKKAKFDPNNVKSVQTLQEEKKIKEEEEEAKEEESEEENEMKPVEVDIKDLKPMTKVSSITELQERLKKSIDDLRAKRKAQSNNSIHSRDELLKKRLKRKRDRKEQIQKKKEKRRKTNDMAGMDLPETQAAEEKVTKTKEVEENVSFGKIVFDEGVEKKKKKGPTDTLGRLKQAEANKEKLEKLKSVDKEKAEALEEKIQWNKAMKLIEGEKIKDDPKLLKKTLKREQKLKERSAKKWNDRQKTVARQMKEKQKKREENIKNRMNNKGKKGGKKRHGLEGSGLKRK